MSGRKIGRTKAFKIVNLSVGSRVVGFHNKKSKKWGMNKQSINFSGGSHEYC